MFTKKSEIRTSALRQAIKPQPRPLQTRRKEIEIVHAKLKSAELLSLADDGGQGCDPYNSTGQHTIIRPDKD